MNIDWEKIATVLKKIKINGLFLINHWGANMQQVAVRTLEWVSILLLHCASIPSLLAFMSGLVDSPFDVDFVLFIYTALVLLFIKSLISKDTLNIFTIGIGFVVQAVMMSLILAK